MQAKFLSIICLALTISSVCANPEGDKLRKSFDAYSDNYVGHRTGNYCEILEVECNRGRLEILQILADQARAYKATSEAAGSLNGKLADVVIEDNDVEHAFYKRLAERRGASGKDMQPFIDVQKKLVEVLMTERDEVFKRSIQ